MHRWFICAVFLAASGCVEEEPLFARLPTCGPDGAPEGIEGCVSPVPDEAGIDAGTRPGGGDGGLDGALSPTPGDAGFDAD